MSYIKTGLSIDKQVKKNIDIRRHRDYPSYCRVTTASDNGQRHRHIHEIQEGVCSIARKSAPIDVIVYYPKTEEGKRELAERVAGVHADMVTQYIQKLNCPTSQKLALLDAVIASAKKASRTA